MIAEAGDEPATVVTPVVFRRAYAIVQSGFTIAPFSVPRQVLGCLGCRSWYICPISAPMMKTMEV